MSGAHAILNEIVSEVSAELLAQYALDVEATPEPGHVDGAQCAAVLGFSGDLLKGVVGIVAEYPVLEESRRVLLGAVGSRGDVHDWAGELSNQLVGRLKNRLLKRGEAIHLATPMVLRGLQLEVRGSERPPVVHGYKTQHGQVWIWLDADVAPEATLDLVPETDDDALDEGGMMMF